MMDDAILLEQEIQELKSTLIQKENLLKAIKSKTDVLIDELSNDDIARYSRQIICPQLGVEGQLRLKKASVLIVGAGGLGCPAGLYLVSAGVGNIGIVDHDEVEKSNLHRQTLHNASSIGISKSHSAKNALMKINDSVKIMSYPVQLGSHNATEIIRNYDVILDCTDNVATRYLLNDACILNNKTLVSGSALQFEGQLTVYNYNRGPCYRCIYPTPPPPETVTNCGDGGIIGAVTGVIGSLQALEAIKILAEIKGVLSGRLLIFDGVETKFRNVKLRPKRENCDICSDKPIITRLIDYEQFCGMRATDKDFSLSLLEQNERISVFEYRTIIETNAPHLLIDVRSPIEFEICKLDGSINIPLKDILDDKRLDDISERIKTADIPVFLLCRRGNDSQLAVKHLQGKLRGLGTPKDIIGGLHAWHYKIDTEFPIY